VVRLVNSLCPSTLELAESSQAGCPGSLAVAGGENAWGEAAGFEAPAYLIIINASSLEEATDSQALEIHQRDHSVTPH